MLSDRELWACAAEAERQHGEGAALFIAERIGALLLSGDLAGIETWKAIAGRLQQLRGGAVRSG